MASSNVNSVTKYFPTVNEGFISTVGGGGVTSGGTTVPLTSVTGLTNGSVFVGIIEPKTPNQQVFTGTVDTAGGQIIDVEWTRGDNTPHLAGATVVDWITGTYINMITTGILKFANQDGTLKAITAPSANIAGTVAANALTVATNATVNATTLTGVTTVSGKSVSSVHTMSSGATLTPDSNMNISECASLGANTTIAAPSGTPVNMQNHTLRLRATGATRTIAWNAIYTPIGITLPTSLAASKTLWVSMAYSTAQSRWEVLSIGREA